MIGSACLLLSISLTHLDLLGTVDGAEYDLGKASTFKGSVADPADDPPALLHDGHTDVVLVEDQSGDVLARHLG